MAGCPIHPVASFVGTFTGISTPVTVQEVFADISEATSRDDPHPFPASNGAECMPCANSWQAAPATGSEAALNKISHPPSVKLYPSVKQHPLWGWHLPPTPTFEAVPICEITRCAWGSSP